MASNAYGMIPYHPHKVSHILWSTKKLDEPIRHYSFIPVQQLKEKLQKIEEERVVEREENTRREEENRQMLKRLKDIEAMFARQYPPPSPPPPSADTSSRDHPLFR